MVKNLVEQFFPCSCFICGNEFPEINQYICKNCAEKLNFISPPLCESCGGEIDNVLKICSKCLPEEKANWKNAISIFKMQGLSEQLIYRYKYRGATYLARIYSEFAYNALYKSSIDIDYIMAVPLHWFKYIIRGYNQSTLIAELISKKIGIPLLKNIKRKTYTKSQTKLSGKQRRINIKNNFVVKKLDIIKNKNILLVDDVFTTGSTMRDVAQTLNEAGVKSVNILTIART